MSEPRTWTLDVPSGVIKPPAEPSFASEELVRVIELEPVLDLLERAAPLIAEWPHGNSMSLQEVEALLRSHGRLQEPAA